MKALTENEKQSLIDLVEVLVDNGFKQALEVSGWEKHAREWAGQHHRLLDSLGCYVTCGATRVVVISDEDDWVLKFSFLDSLVKTDYNLLEAENYQAAIEAGLSRYFAATYCLGNICGLEVYVQERVNADEDGVSDEFYNYTLENYYSDCRDDYESEEDLHDAAWEDSTELENEDRIWAMVGDFDRKDCIKLVEFCDVREINDLHAANWGFRDGWPVMIDYSGY